MARIVIVGAGAIGGTLSSLMTKGGEDVTVIDTWDENVKGMREKGVLLETMNGSFELPVRVLHVDEVKEKLKGTFDIAIISVKSYNTEWAVNFIRPYTTDATWFISAQNCINEEIIAPMVGAHRTLGCMIMLSTWLRGPRHIKHYVSMGEQVKGVINYTVGELDGRITPRLEQVRQIFSHCGGAVTTTEIWNERWSKLAINCMANAVSGITGLGNWSIRDNPRSRRVLLKLGADCVKVGRTLGYQVAPPFKGFTLDEMEQAANDGLPHLEKAIVGTAPKGEEGAPSMLQDILKGRKTEIDYMNGYVARRGQAMGVPAPYSFAVTSVVKGIEAGEFKMGIDNVDRVIAIAEAR